MPEKPALIVSSGLMPGKPLSVQHGSVFTILALVWALLFAQWIGLSHRIEHAEFGQLKIASASSHASGKLASDSSISHSCEAFEAAALGSILLGPTFAVPLFIPASILIPGIPKRIWSARFSCHFLSRAPPLV